MGCYTDRVVRLAAEIYRAPAAGLWLKDGCGGIGLAGWSGVEPAAEEELIFQELDDLARLARQTISRHKPFRQSGALSVPLSDGDGVAFGALAVRKGSQPGPGPLADLARMVETERTLRRALKTDALTGAASRPHFLARLGEACAAGERGVLLLADVDHFKSINDRYGHAAGDRILRQVVARMARRVGPGTLIGRLGGEEFALLSSGVPEDRLTGLATVVCRAVAERSFGTGAGPHIDVTVSIGAVSLSAAADPAELFACVDSALYRAKASGRNRIALNCPEADARTIPSARA